MRDTAQGREDRRGKEGQNTWREVNQEKEKEKEEMRAEGRGKERRGGGNRTTGMGEGIKEEEIARR